MHATYRPLVRLLGGTSRLTPNKPPGTERDRSWAWVLSALSSQGGASLDQRCRGINHRHRPDLVSVLSRVEKTIAHGSYYFRCDKSMMELRPPLDWACPNNGGRRVPRNSWLVALAVAVRRHHRCGLGPDRVLRQASQSVLTRALTRTSVRSTGVPRRHPIDDRLVLNLAGSSARPASAKPPKAGERLRPGNKGSRPLDPGQREHPPGTRERAGRVRRAPRPLLKEHEWRVREGLV